ncbi:MAG: hypothetical protein ACE5KM_22965, partial [Planctomycetaceae bacterium]
PWQTVKRRQPHGKALEREEVMQRFFVRRHLLGLPRSASPMNHPQRPPAQIVLGVSACAP